MSDHELLQRYARERSDPAFATLVARHLALVYSAARRQVRSPQLAEDVTQSVFLALSRQAADLPADQSLVAWLHVVTRRTAIDLVRAEARRRTREHAAATLDHPPAAPSAWTEIEPLLDEAVESLPEPERTAILLRFFENKNYRDVGSALGTSDDAAQKRVTRALDQLRTFFLRRGITVTAAGLTADLGAHAILTAPAALAGAITTLGTATLPAVIATAAETAVMTTLQKSLVTAALVACGGVALYQANLITGQSAELATVTAQNIRATTELRALQLAHTAAVANLKTVEQQIDARLAAARPSYASDAALEAQMEQWLAQIDQMKDFLAQHPEWDIPELKLLTDRAWFDTAAGGQIKSEVQFRRATAQLRDRAMSLAAQKISKALNAYVRAHDGQLPANPMELAPFHDPPLDPAMLRRYEMLHTGKSSEVPRSETSRILAPRPADLEYDANFYIGTDGYGNNGVAMGENVRTARRRFSEAHVGERATTAEQLQPYLRWPTDLATLERYLATHRQP